MADTVTTQVLSNTGLRYEILLTCVSDGTGETNVPKINVLDIHYPHDTTRHPIALGLEEVQASNIGFTALKLLFDRAPAPKTFLVVGDGYTDLCFSPRLVDPDKGQVLSTGNILLSTTGASSGDIYSIKLRFKCYY